jgi:putative nucleotidyltransferase with HDIG domain
MATQRGGRWVARPVLAGLIRLLVVLVPAVAGALASWEVSRIWEQPTGFWPVAGWFLALVAVAVVVVLVVQRFVRRFLPLAWLFSMTLAFPDRTPSRMVTARRAASRRARRKALEGIKGGTLGANAAEASEAALVLVAALGAHDKRTRGHSERVRTLADLLAKEAGFSDEERDKLRWGALLHDIGKLAVPGDILNKPDRPNEQEWATLQRHPEEGAHLVEPLVTWLGPWADAVGHHHEKWDGTGYPHGLAGEDISLGARILAIADSYEVMTAARAYKVPMSAAAAREELVASAGTHFDPALVRAFMGVSLGALWWTAGVASLLAQIPLLGRVGALPGVARIRTGLAGSATAVATVAALVVVGAVGTRSADEPAVSRTGTVQSAAPASPAAAAPPPTAAPPASDSSAAAAPAGTAASPAASGPVAARPAPFIARPPADVGTTVAPATPATGIPSSAPPVAEPGPDPSPGAPPRQFTAIGQLVAPNLLGLVGLSLTGTGGVGGCGPSASQGLDAWVFELPADGPAPGAPVHAVGDDLLGLHNLTVTFVSEDCRTVGRLDTDAADEAGVLPAGTRFVVLTDRLGIGTTVSLTVG